MKNYKKWATAGMALCMVGVLAGCAITDNGTSPAANGTSANVMGNTNTIASNRNLSSNAVKTQTQGDSMTQFSDGSPSKSWIQGIIMSNSPLKAGVTLDISGRLARVQRNPNIQVLLYQSKGPNYKENAVRLVQKNLAVTGNATFNGSLTVPNLDTSYGTYFTLVFKYKGEPQAFAMLLKK